MGVVTPDDWVDIPPLDEFSLDNAANSVHGRPNRLLHLSRNDPRFAEVEQLFTKGWKHSKKDRPVVHFIFKVLWTEALLEPYIAYRSSVQQRVKAKDNPGNEQLLFHGTNRACLLGETGNNVLLCNLGNCSLCSILRTSFDVKRCGSKNAFKRYAETFLVSNMRGLKGPQVWPWDIYNNVLVNILEADDYISNLCKYATLRVTMVSRVVIGRPYKRYYNAPGFTSPPDGYDSVAGEIGWALNYEETVTYHNDTIRPAYLVVYGKEKDPPLTGKEFLASMFKTPLAS